MHTPLRSAVTLLLASGCARSSVGLQPDSGPMSGYYEVRIDLTEARVAPDDVVAVHLGGVPAYDLVVQGDGIRVWIQGAATPGPADLALDLGDDEVIFEQAFRFEPAADPLFERMYAIGASLTQGVQGGVPTRHAQLHSPGHYLATQAGAWFPLPLLNEGLFPTIEPEDVGPAPACAVPNVVDFVASAAVDVFAQINDVENNRLDFALARTTPELAPHNVAVGGSNIQTLVDGPQDDFATGFLAKLVYDVHADITDDVTVSQLDLVEAAEPTLVLCTDTYGNDLIVSVVEGLGIDPAKLTPEALFREKLAELLERMSATGAEVFLANIPRATLLPVTTEKISAAVLAAQRQAETQGTDPVAAGEAAAAAIGERAAQVEAMGLLYNEILDELALGYGNVHVVDFYGVVEGVDHDGLVVGDSTLDVKKFGGLLSTDGVHFSDTGYAMVANLFMDTIESELGVSVPRLDLVPIAADDPYHPDALRARGLEPTACDPR